MFNTEWFKKCGKVITTFYKAKHNNFKFAFKISHGILNVCVYNV